MSAPIQRGKPAHSDPDLYKQESDDLEVDIESLPEEGDVELDADSEPDLSVDEPSANPDDYPTAAEDFPPLNEENPEEVNEFLDDDSAAPVPESAKPAPAKTPKKGVSKKVPPQSTLSKVPQLPVPDRPIGSVVKPKTQSSEVVPDQRILRQTSTVYHDLYQLMPANMVKDLGFKGDHKLYRVAHCHFYHTFDSNGRAMKHSSPTGNHFHELIPKQVKDPATGEMKLEYVCGPAVREKRVFSARQKRWVKGYEYLPHNDRHTHQVKYCHSQEIQTRQTNPMAAAVIAQEEQKLAPINGIQG